MISFVYIFPFDGVIFSSQEPSWWWWLCCNLPCLVLIVTNPHCPLTRILNQMGAELILSCQLLFLKRFCISKICFLITVVIESYIDNLGQVMNSSLRQHGLMYNHEVDDNNLKENQIANPTQEVIFELTSRFQGSIQT